MISKLLNNSTIRILSAVGFAFARNNNLLHFTSDQCSFYYLNSQLWKDVVRFALFQSRVRIYLRRAKCKPTLEPIVHFVAIHFLVVIQHLIQLLDWNYVNCLMLIVVC